jgi:predicted dehydrogenase
MDNVAIIGAGLMGTRRADAIQRCGGRVTLVVDTECGRAEALAHQIGCAATGDWRAAVSQRDVDIVVVCTWPVSHAAVTLAAIHNRKHIMCEKPFGRTPEEATEIVRAARRSGVKVKVGFNMRHKAGIAKAHQLLCEGAVGEVMFIRCTIGHGGRPGYDQEWRASSQLSGGGLLMDLGIHAVDLIRWFMEEPESVFALAATMYWPMQPLEDNAFVLFQNGQGQIASLHSSCTQWKNAFAFEVFGTNGSIACTGLGGSYGVERVSLVRRREQQLPEETEFAFPGEDRCWDSEWLEFMAAIKDGREPLGNGYDGWRALTFVHAAYQSARDGRMAHVPRPNALTLDQ